MNSVASEKRRRLIEQLLEKTRGGALRWEEGIDGRTFTLKLGEGYVFISRSTFEEDDDRHGVQYRLDLCDEDGHPVESERETVFDEHRETGQLTELYQLARASSRGTTGIVDRMLSALAA